MNQGSGDQRFSLLNLFGPVASLLVALVVALSLSGCPKPKAKGPGGGGRPGSGEAGAEAGKGGEREGVTSPDSSGSKRPGGSGGMMGSAKAPPAADLSDRVLLSGSASSFTALFGPMAKAMQKIGAGFRRNMAAKMASEVLSDFPTMFDMRMSKGGLHHGKPVALAIFGPPGIGEAEGHGHALGGGLGPPKAKAKATWLGAPSKVRAAAKISAGDKVNHALVLSMARLWNPLFQRVANSHRKRAEAAKKAGRDAEARRHRRLARGMSSMLGRMPNLKGRNVVITKTKGREALWTVFLPAEEIVSWTFPLFGMMQSVGRTPEPKPSVKRGTKAVSPPGLTP